jgi:hypothetical protein
MEKKQTAVNWFYDTMKNKKIGDGQILIDIDTLLNDFEQAKQMEKEQIEEAWDEGQECEYQYFINSEPKYDSNTYYNETYGGQDE